MSFLDCYYCGRPAVPNTDVCVACLAAYPTPEAANRETGMKRLIAAILRGDV